MSKSFLDCVAGQEKQTTSTDLRELGLWGSWKGPTCLHNKKTHRLEENSKAKYCALKSPRGSLVPFKMLIVDSMQALAPMVHTVKREILPLTHCDMLVKSCR